MRRTLTVPVFAILAAVSVAAVRAEAAVAPTARTVVVSATVPATTTAPSSTVASTSTTVPASTTTVTLPAEPDPAGIADALCPEMWRTALAVGFTEDDLPDLDRIVWAESRCDPTVVSPTRDYGLAQINWAAHGHRLTAEGVTREMLLEPWINLAQALWIAQYAEEHYGCRWQPWYMSGEWC